MKLKRRIVSGYDIERDETLFRVDVATDNPLEQIMAEFKIQGGGNMRKRYIACLRKAEKELRAELRKRKIPLTRLRDLPMPGRGYKLPEWASV